MKKTAFLMIAILITFLIIEVPFAFANSNELPLVPAPVPPSIINGLPGDADSNGTVNYQDALLVLRHSIGLEKLEKEVVQRCDVDGNGFLNYQDALMILRYSIGLIESF